jgi:hypothetical protein
MQAFCSGGAVKFIFAQRKIQTWNQKTPLFAESFVSGRRELNPGPLAPHASALAGLRHAPSGRRYYSRD